MPIFILVALMFGAVAGMRFRVLALIPVSVGFVGALILTGAHRNPLITALAAIASLTALQIGYFGGALLCATFTRAQAS